MENNNEIRKTEMDRLMVYQSLLAAENHCDEIIYGDVNFETKVFVEGIKNETEAARDMVMPEEADKDFHCLVKHYAAAYEGAREIFKVTKKLEDRTLMTMTHDLLVTCLEKLWGHKLINCERCGVKEEDATGGIQKEDSGSIAGPINY